MPWCILKKMPSGAMGALHDRRVRGMFEQAFVAIASRPRGWRLTQFKDEVSAQRELKRLRGFGFTGLKVVNSRTPVRPLLRRKNPAPRSKPSSRDARMLSTYRRETADARRLFESFTGHAATTGRRVDYRVPKVIMEVGKLDGLLYETVRDGEVERYIHRFKKSARPTLCVSHDGRTLVILGGGYQFTEAGIEDRIR